MYYRLGPLGFPQGAEASAKKALNLGLKDIIAGLQWVQSNIEVFSGDKNKVTLFGQSAGATAVFELALSSHIRGLARAAIEESTGFCPPSVQSVEKEYIWQTFVGAVPGCTPYLSSDREYEFHFPRRASSCKSRFRLSLIFRKRPGSQTSTVLTAQIRNEFLSLSVPSLQRPPSQELSSIMNKLLDLYPDIPALGSPFGTGNKTFGLNKQYKRFAAIFRDFVFQASRRGISHSLSESGIKLFGYLFTDPNATLTVPFPSAPGSLGIGHGSELSSVFGPSFGTLASPSLSAVMQDYWIPFAVNLDPNNGMAARPQYSPSHPWLFLHLHFWWH
ncbi:Alpha/Beta hydrolase protein [Pholiota molesta]|nr:Alpha/Beta hydrolase protein [Pholiota molesta]